MADPLVEPKDGVTPVTETAAPEAPEAPAATGGADGLPDDLLQLPVVQSLLAGSPPAVSAPLQEFSKRGEAKVIADNAPTLMKAGMGFYKSLDGATGVIFNQMYVHGEEIKQADAAGKLQEVAPPYDAVEGAVSKSGLAHPALSGKTPAAPANAAIPTPPQAAQAPMQGMPASAQRKLATARVKNLDPGGPTSGASPGAGRLLNSIMKPVI